MNLRGMAERSMRPPLTERKRSELSPRAQGGAAAYRQHGSARVCLCDVPHTV